MPQGFVHDPDLLDLLEAIPPKPFAGSVWRVTWASRDPLSGGTGGGRWHPANDFEALYSSLDEDGALAEIYYHLSRAPVFSTANVRINKIEVRAGKSLTIGDAEALAVLGIDRESFAKGDYSRTRQVGAAARFLDFDGLLVPSARWPCQNLVLFPDRLENPEALRLVESRDINWPAWREKSPLEDD